jgi:hypothetical protein
MKASQDSAKHYQALRAREELMTNLLKAMADHRLDAIVHKAVEHQPTLISEGLKPPYVNYKGAPHLNTFLVFVPSVVVPAGFTRDNLPAGIVFLGRPYDDGNMIKFAYAYEQANKASSAAELYVTREDFSAKVRRKIKNSFDHEGHEGVNKRAGADSRITRTTALRSAFLHEESLMPLRVVIECAEDLIPKGLIKRPGLVAECIEVRSGAAALFGGVLHGGYQLPTVASVAQGLRDPHESDVHPIPVDLAPYATDNRSALITQEHAEGLKTWSLGIRECVGGQPLRQDAHVLAARGFLDG